MTIPGLHIARSGLQPAQHDFCVEQIEQGVWLTNGLHRRTQHYGYVYDYRARAVDQSAYLGPLPTWLIRLGAVVSRSAGIDVSWQQAIVNEYPAGIGIGEHADARVFGPVVASVSLLSSTIVRYRPSYQAASFIPVSLDPGDVLVMTAPARSPWTHEIVGADIGSRRLSITFRTIA